MTASTAVAADERVARSALLDRLVTRPELGSVLGALLVLVFFATITTGFRTTAGVSVWLDDASGLGIVAVPVALLMIGGEFDLSAGVMTGSTALVTALLATRAHLNVWPSLLISLLAALAVGAFNGWLVMRTKLPSFIVTLGTFFALQGLNLGFTRLITGTVLVGGIDEASGYSSAGQVFASSISVAGTKFPVQVVWWLAVTAVVSWLLLRTRFGNWVFAVGGSSVSARSVGVPVKRTKILLFMSTAAAGWLVGTITILRFTNVQANAGIGNEFQYIIAAVIGGCLLTGGFGSPIGAAIGALIFGMARQGIIFARWNTDWFYLFLGVLLLAAVLVNTAFRARAERSRR